jgi:hypothetical protein
MKRDRAFRIEQRERVIKNRVKLKKDTDLVHRHEDQPGRYAKRHPYDCGNPECLVCHGEKVLGMEKLEDKVIEDSYKDQVRDEFGGD